MPATTSSSIIPNPPGIFSIFLIPPILEISKNLKSIKAKIIQIEFLVKNKHEIQIPTISSITTLEGSESSEVDKLFEDHTPKINNKNTIRSWKNELDSKGIKINNNNPNKLAKEPGAIGIRPIPRHEAIILDLLFKKNFNNFK